MERKQSISHRSLFFESKDIEEESVEPPMNYLWRELGLDSCPEPVLIMWLAMFIIGSCCSLSKETIQEIDVPPLEEIQTAEDLFYMTILMLYDRYKSLD